MAKKKKKAEKPRHAPTKRQLSHFKQHQRRQRFIFGSGILIIVAVLVIIGVGVYFGWYVPEVQPLNETVIRVNDTEFSMDYYLKFMTYQALQLQAFGLEITYDQMVPLAEGTASGIENNELVRQEAEKLGITVSDEEIQEKLDAELGENDPALIADYREVIDDIFMRRLLTDKLLAEYFDPQVPRSAEQRQILAMFLESQSQAEEVRERLEAGELFTELAAELCLDNYCKSQEGDLGWQPRGILPRYVDSSILEESAFSAEVRVLSQPIYEETKLKTLGYWLIQVEFVDAEAETAELKVMLLGSEQEANEVRARLEAGEDFAALAGEFSQHEASRDEGGEFELTTRGRFAPAFDEFVFDPELEMGTLSQPIRDDIINTEGGYWLIKVVRAEDDRLLEEEVRDILKGDLLNEWLEGLPENPDNIVENYLDEEKTDWAIFRVLEG